MNRVDIAFVHRCCDEIKGTVAMLDEECSDNDYRRLAIASELQRQALCVLEKIFGDAGRAAEFMMMMLETKP